MRTKGSLMVRVQVLKKKEVFGVLEPSICANIYGMPTLFQASRLVKALQTYCLSHFPFIFPLYAESRL